LVPRGNVRIMFALFARIFRGKAAAASAGAVIHIVHHTGHHGPWNMVAIFRHTLKLSGSSGGRGRGEQ
jgi:hypothetical protein